MAFGIQHDSLSNRSDGPEHSLVPSYLSFRRSRILQKLMIARRDGLHHMDPWPLEDCIMGGHHVDHIKLCNDDIWISTNR